MWKMPKSSSFKIRDEGFGLKFEIRKKKQASGQVPKDIV
jgi:hypothetical protein